MRPLEIYDRKTAKRLAYLQNAYEITYTQETNSVWSASFKLPYSDEKKEYCQPLNYVVIWDEDNGGADKYVGLFRIMPTKNELSRDKSEITYTLEHAFSTLLDTTIVGYKYFGYNEETEEYETTSTVLNQLLDMQVNLPKKWVLDECDYDEEYVYEFEDDTLLSAVLEIPQILPDGYFWKFNTRVRPFQVSLKAIDENPVTDLRYKKNIAGITKTVDPRNICTRLYAYGANQEDGSKLSIKSVNNGREYIDSPEGIAEYGIIMHILNDGRFEDVQALFNYAQSYLSKLSAPIVSYEIDLNVIFEAANLRIGDVVRVITEDGLDENLVVQRITKDDLTGKPKEGKIIIGQGTVDLGIIYKSFM